MSGTAQGLEPRRAGWTRVVACLVLGFLGVVLSGCDRPQSQSPPPPARRAAPPRPAPRSARPAPAPGGLPQRAIDTRFARSPAELVRSDPHAVPEAAAGTNWIQSRPAGCRLPFYQLKIAPEDLTRLQRYPRENERFPATFTAGAEIFDGVGVRDRGDWARSWPKKSLKLFFDRGQLFEGQKTLNLNSGWHDPAFVREPLAYHVYAAAGVPAPRSRMVRLHVNGQFRGLYVEVEQPDKAFLRRYGLEGASAYKAASRSNQSDERELGGEAAYRLHYEKQTQKTESYEELQSFCQDLAGTTNALSFFERRVDLDTYISYLAVTVLVQNWDCYNKNHYLVRDTLGSRKWVVVPWDVDRTFGDYSRYGFSETRLPILHGTRERPGSTGWNRLADRFLSEPRLRARFLDRLAALLETEFTAEKLYPVLDRFESDIAAEAAMDRQRWGGGSGELSDEIAQLKRYIQERRAYVKSELKTLRP
jgi:spore coat protein H